MQAQAQHSLKTTLTSSLPPLHADNSIMLELK